MFTKAISVDCELLCIDCVLNKFSAYTKITKKKNINKQNFSQTL